MDRFQITDYIEHLSIDCVVFGYKDHQLKVLLVQYKYNTELWSLPGGHILKTESVDGAAERILKKRTNLDHIYLAQFHAFGAQDRILSSPDRERLKRDLQQFNPQHFTPEVIAWMTSRFVSIGYYALVDCNRVTPIPGALEASLNWVNITELPLLMHDHANIVKKALKALQQNLDEQLLVYNLLPEEFTMKDIRDIYETVYNREFPMNNFQKKILELGVLERLGKKFEGGQHRAPFLYRFNKKDA